MAKGATEHPDEGRATRVAVLFSVLAPWSESHPRADDELYSESWGAGEDCGSHEGPKKAASDDCRFL